MERLRPYPVTAFCALTLFIWTTRIPLAWTNDEDSLPVKILWSVPITAFWVAAAVLLALLLTGRAVTTAWFASVARVFALGTIAYWAIRLPMIMVAEPPASVDSEAAFKVVHAVLATVSIAAATLAWRSPRTGVGASEGGATPAAA
ncbi:hypothetical protein BH10ACT1_BH10ACT1_11450 [soil metagenome]